MDNEDRTKAYALPSFSIDTSQLPRNTAFGVWQDEIIPYWEARLHDKRAETFDSAADGYLFGDIMVGRVRTASQHLDRSRYRIARDGLSQYGFQFIMDGGIGGRDGGSEGWAGAKGDLFVSDLAQTMRVEACNLRVLYFSVPRHLLAPRLNNPDHHNTRVLPANTPLVGLLNTHLATALRLAPTLNATDARTIMNVTLELTAAVLNAQVTQAQADAVALAITQNIRHYIEGHIQDGGLSADAVAARFSMSRRKLYYLFEPFGGFDTYVRERRLRHIRRALADSTLQMRQIADIAQAFGFRNYPGFVRAFRRSFGISPSAARALAAQGNDEPQERTGNSIWHSWLSRTR